MKRKNKCGLNTGMWKTAFSSSAQLTAETEIETVDLSTNLYRKSDGLKAGEPKSGSFQIPKLC